MDRTRLGSGFLLLFVLLMVFASPARAQTEGFDLVLLLDESGSMKQTDPADARLDASEMFLRLCGPEHRVAVVGFSTGVRILGDLEPMGPGSEREALLDRLRDVRSDGEWTDIEMAVRQAVDDLVRNARPRARRIVLLMTDGRVDLAAGERAEEASMRRLQGSLLNEILQENIEVYGVAFSPGVDAALLDRLARTTGAISVSGRDGDELQMLFLRLFEEIAQPQTLPINDGSVLIDASVREATFLITHKNSPPVTVSLGSPDGTKMTQKSARANVQWFASPSYDLVTVTGPAPGPWVISPLDTEGDDRVLVLTDMRLELDEFKAVVRPDEVLTVAARIVSEDKTVDAPEIIQRLRMHGSLHDRPERFFDLLDDGRHDDLAEEDGVFGNQIVAPRDTGFYDLEIIARGPTLERRIVRSLTVADQWFTAEAERLVLDPGEPVAIKVHIREPEIARSAEQMRFQATIEDPQGTRHQIVVDPVTPFLWSAGFGDTEQPGLYQITLQGSFVSPEGQRVTESFGPLKVRARAQDVAQAALPISHEKQHPAPTPHATPAHTPEHTPEADEVPVTQVSDEPPSEETPAEPEEAGEGTAWGFWLGVGGFCLLGILVTVGAVGWLRNQPAAKGDAKIADMRKLREKAKAAREKEYDVPDVPEGDDLAEDMHGAETRIESTDDPDAQEGVEIIPPAQNEEELSGILVEVGMESPATGNEDSAASDDEPTRLEPAEEPADDEAPVEDQPEAEEPPAADEADITLSDSESDLLAEIMGEDASGETAEPEPEQPTVPDDNKAEEEESVDTATPESEQEAQPQTAGLSENEDQLLAEIMGDVGGDAEPPAADEAPAPAAEEPQAEPAAESSQSEDDLLAEIMGDIGGAETTEPAPAASESSGPSIPDEDDKRSDDEMIDDILKDIEGLVE